MKHGPPLTRGHHRVFDHCNEPLKPVPAILSAPAFHAAPIAAVFLTNQCLEWFYAYLPAVTDRTIVLNPELRWQSPCPTTQLRFLFRPRACPMCGHGHLARSKVSREVLRPGTVVLHKNTLCCTKIAGAWG